MSRALVIKNADFSINKITTVEFNDVPCTGAAFTSSSVALTRLGTAEIDYNVTPFDTTDNIILESSDTSILTVEGTTIEVVGIGECILTLKCGAYSDVCNVSVDIYESPIIGSGTFSSKTIDDVYGIRFGSTSTTPRLLCMGLYSDEWFEKEIKYYNKPFDLEEVTAIKIPQNTSRIHLSGNYAYSTNSIENGFICFTNADEVFTDSGYDYVVSDYPSNNIEATSTGLGNNVVDQYIDIPNGLTGYVIVFRLDSTRANALYEITTEYDAVTFANETIELSIHYLPESEM